MEIKTIYEDQNIIAVNKPAGLLVHGGENIKTNIPTLVDWILKKYPEIKKIGDDPLRPGIVHRLDKDTSGILIIAKNQKAFDYFKEQFKRRKIKKVYIALVNGLLKEDKGIIDLPIGKSKKDFRKKLASKKAIGKTREALTEYKVLKRFKNPNFPMGGFTLIEVFPKTGRTHQIRVHLKTLGHPIVGDRLYGFKKDSLDRQFLHASSLEFTNIDASRLKLEADLPDELKNFLNMLN